jgi:hypothetical protein
MSDPIPEEARRILAEARLRRHGWTRFDHGVRRAALRQIRRMNDA